MRRKQGVGRVMNMGEEVEHDVKRLAAPVPIGSEVQGHDHSRFSTR
jgi:hypothetical protein